MSDDLLTLPRLGETMETGRVVAWHIAPGQAFRRGDTLVEVETDKTVVEVPALADGVLGEILAAEGDTIDVGEPLARLAGATPAPASERIETLEMPRLGETMETGVLVAWLVAEGADYARGDMLAEIETDKTLAEVPALSAGRVVEHLVPEGTTVAVGQPIARIAIEGAPDAPEPEQADPPSEPPSASPAPEPAPATRPRDPGAPVRATPLARRLARKAGLDITQIPGTGRRGRVERGDVEARIGGAASPPGDTLQHAFGLAHTVTGPETGTPVLLLHGFAADHSVWSALASGLARAGRRVLSVDLPGHGATTTEANTPQDLSQGLPQLIQHVFGASAPHVVAHSLGAVPAVALAQANGTRTLTLIAPFGLGLQVDMAFVTGLAGAPSEGELTHLLARMTEGPLPLSDTAIAGIGRTLAQGRLKTLASTMIGTAGQAVSLRKDLAHLAETRPVRILTAHRDRILDWQDTLTVSPRIAIHHLPQAGHVAQWDAPSEVLAVVLAATA